ncbi:MULTISPECIES: hypothetical protein [Saccharothrix]|uniref:hypothetical protein n=1 Tax=Saccharothrix TaxID=2071 RepID=UPI00093FDE38|nr:hypothetical protein [Saccharothrix sp. CB00851]OKI23209.1 hypothetical protein A6A25_35385 [Saccharothrix sp. CB00851]
MTTITRRTLLRGGLLAATGVITTRLGGTAAAEPHRDGFAVAYNDLVITPHAPPWPSLWMGGYGWTKRGSQGAVARDLHAHCLTLRDGDRGVRVLVRVDVVGIPRDVHQEIRRRVCDQERLVASPDFLIVASHTHSGPFLGDTHPDPYVLMGLEPADIDAVNGSTALFVDLVVELVRRTVGEQPIPATLHYAEGSAEIGFNRAGLDHVITDVPVLLVRDTDDGAPLAVLFGATCHPVCRGRDDVFDSDFVGAAAEAVERELGVMALFFQGTAGDHDPVGGQGPHRPAELGRVLADAVLEVVRRDRFTPVTGPVRGELIEVQLPFSVDLGDPGAVAELERKYRSRLDGHLGQAEVRHAEVVLRRLGDGSFPRSFPMPLQCWKFGGLTVLALAHEVLSSYHVLLKGLAGRLGTGPLWIMAYANETQGYVPADETSWRGGYEAGWGAGDPHITGAGSNMVAYGWPAPLRGSPVGADPATPDSTEAIVLSACEGLLR